MANQTNTNIDIDTMLKEMSERREKYMAEARSIVAACKAKSSLPYDLDRDGNFVFDGVKYKIAINENEKVIAIIFNKFRYNTTESELADAGIAFSLNADAINYCISKWLKNEH